MPLPTPRKGEEQPEGVIRKIFRYIDLLKGTNDAIAHSA